jgi:hypothetical protein
MRNEEWQIANRRKGLKMEHQRSKIKEQRPKIKDQRSKTKDQRPKMKEGDSRKMSRMERMHRMLGKSRFDHIGDEGEEQREK